MAYYYFPSQTDYYRLPTGNYRIAIKQKAPAPPDIPSSEDVDLMLLEMGKLVYEFEIDPASQKERYARLHLTFHNKDNFFESPDFMTDLESNHLFVSIYKESGGGGEYLIFYGFLERTNIERLDYRVNSFGELIYQRIKFTVLDALYYYSANNVKLLDVTTVDADGFINLSTGFRDIILNLDYSESITITDHILYSHCDYDIRFSDLGIFGEAEFFGVVTADTDVKTFITNVIKAVGLRVYNYGHYMIEPKEEPFTDTTIDVADIINIRKARQSKIYKVVSVKGKKNYHNFINLNDTKDDTEFIYLSNEGLIFLDNEQLKVDIKKMTQLIYWKHGNSDWTISNPYPPSPAKLTPTGWDGRYITQTGEDFCTDQNAFEGMRIVADVNSRESVYAIRYVSNEQLEIIANQEVTHGNDEIYNGEDYYIVRDSGVIAFSGWLTATPLLLKRLSLMYEILYVNRENNYIITLFNIDKYQELSANISIPNILEPGAKIKKAVFDFNNNTIQFVLL